MVLLKMDLTRGYFRDSGEEMEAWAQEDIRSRRPKRMKIILIFGNGGQAHAMGPTWLQVLS